MTKKRWRAAVWVGMALLLALGLGMVWGERGPVYPVLDSGHSSFERDIVWLDNHRVLFRGFEGGELPTAAKRKGFYIWDTRTNQVSWYGKGGGHLCFYKGLVYYEYYGGEKPTKELPYQESWRIGLLGSEKYHVHRYKTGGISRNNALKRSHVDCRLQRHEVVNQGFWIPLREQDDALVVDMDEHEIIYRRRPLALSSVYSLDFTDIRFVSRKGAYFIQQQAGVGRIGWDENGGCLPVYWLYPSGDVKEICVPHGPWSKNGIDAVIPTRRGLVLQDSELDSDRDWETALYWVEKKNVWRRLIRGRVGRTVASPDGCRIAFTHFRNSEIMSPDVPGYRTVKMIDLCAAQDTQ